MRFILAVLPIIQAFNDSLISTTEAYILGALIGLIMLVVGLWLRPMLEKTWSRNSQKNAESVDYDEGGSDELVIEKPTTDIDPEYIAFEMNQTAVEPDPPEPTKTQFDSEVDYINFEYRYYQQQIISKWEKIEFQVIANQQPLLLHREDFFVSPKFSIRGSTKRSFTLGDLLKNFQHLILLGNPGSGKTETVYYLLLSFARQEGMERLGLEQKLIPVLLSASELGQALASSSELSLPDLLKQKLQSPPAGYIKDRLAQGRFLLLLDGLNQISIPEVKQILGWLEAQVVQNPENRIIIVARLALLDAFSQTNAFTIAEFVQLDANSLETLAQKWGGVIPGTLDTLTSIIQEDKAYSLARIPYHLLMLLFIVPLVKMLPTNKAQLFSAYLKILLSPTNRKQEASFQFSETEKRAVLQSLAFTLHQNHQIDFEEQALSKMIHDSLAAIDNQLENAEQLFTEFCLQSGLIIRKNGRYRFTHLSLQEFLVAQAQGMTEVGLNQILVENAANPWWHEVNNFYEELTNTTRVVDQVFTHETKELLDINQDQVYTLSLLGRSITSIEATVDEAPTEQTPSEIFNLDLVDLDLESPTLVEKKEFKILVVDDTPQNIQLARFILQRENYAVMEAPGAEEALKLVQTEKPSLILSDIQMPGMDGYEFCRRIKADNETKNIPFIFITAFSRSTKEAAKGLQIGADDYITRPFAPEELLARIGANMRIYQAEEAARHQALTLARRNRELALLNHIQRAVNSSLNLDEVLGATMEEVHKVLKAEGTSLWFVDRQNESLLLSAASNESPRAIHGMRLPLQEGISGYVARSGQPFLSGDALADPHYQPSITGVDGQVIQSIICVPLRARQQVIGVLQADHHELDHFDQDDLHLLNAVADAVTVAIENAWLFGQIQLFNQQLEQKVEARTRELAREKEKTETILISIADGLLVIDPDYKIMMANRAAEELLDFNLTEAIGSSIEESDFDTPLWKFVRHINAQPDPTFTATTEIRNPNNRDKILSIQAHAAKMWDYTLRTYTGTVIVLRDITAVQEVDRMKARFMAGITHELKTPLAIITLHVGSLLKYKNLTDTKKFEMLRIIQKQTNLLERLVENILQLSRLDSGMLQMQLEPVNLVTLSHQIVTELEPLAKEKGLQLNCTHKKKAILVEADQSQLERVVRNLIDNAIKYTEEGKITVSLLTSHEKKSQGKAILAVADSGLGLSSDQIDKLFDRFYRADPSHNIPGTGLGLSISKEIIRLHKGDIRVESMLGQGSTFTVSLPLMNG